MHDEALASKLLIVFREFQLAFKGFSAKILQFIPKLGGLIAKDEESYQYLVESIARFPTQVQLEDKMKKAGFSRVQHFNLSGGIAAIHMGWKI